MLNLRQKFKTELEQQLHGAILLYSTYKQRWIVLPPKKIKLDELYNGVVKVIIEPDYSSVMDIIENETCQSSFIIFDGCIGDFLSKKMIKESRCIFFINIDLANSYCKNLNAEIELAQAENGLSNAEKELIEAKNELSIAQQHKESILNEKRNFRRTN